MTQSINTPQPPQPGDPQFDQKMQLYIAALLRQSIAATEGLRAFQERAARAAEQGLAVVSQPLPTVDPRRAEVLLLVSTMTKADRAKPATAVQTALSMIAAVDAALGRG